MAYRDTSSIQIQEDFFTSSAPTKAKREKSFAANYEDSIASSSLDSEDAFWSQLAARSSCNNTVREKTYPIIAAIRERVSRDYVHDEVQLNDSRIVSQMYSSYIKKMKDLLNTYTGLSFDEFLQRKHWFLDTGKEAEAKGQEFGRFLFSNTKYKRDIAGFSQATGHAFSLSSKSKGGKVQPIFRKKSVRFNDAPESNNRDVEEAAKRDINKMLDTYNKKGDGLQVSGKTSDILNDSKIETQRRNKKNSKRKSRNSSDSSLMHRERNYRKYRLSIHGILKKEAAKKRSIVPTWMTTKGSSEAQARSEIMYSEIARRKRSTKEEKCKSGTKSDVERHSNFNVRWEEKIGKDHAQFSPFNKWNQTLRLLQRGDLASGHQECKQAEKSYTKLEPSSSLEVPRVSSRARRSSTTPESIALASNSPIGRYSREMRSRLEVAKGTWKNYRKPGHTEKGLKNSNSKTNKAVELQQYDGIGIGKVAKVTTVSSFVRYEFDIPDDLDASLEHLRLHGYLQE